MATTPRPVYSKVFLDEVTSASGAFDSAAVPAGTIWVVRDIVCVNTIQMNFNLGGFSIRAGRSKAAIFVVGSDAALSYYTFHWVGRQVLNAGDFLHCWAWEPNWSMRVSGYELTTP